MIGVHDQFTLLLLIVTIGGITLLSMRHFEYQVSFLRLRTLASKSGGALIALCLLALSACSSNSTSATQSITPLALSTKPTVSSIPSIGNSDWTTYHKNNLRTGYVANTPDPRTLSMLWQIKLDGAVYAEPLAIGNSVIVATEGDSLYSFDKTTGKQQWRTNVGKPVVQSTLPCGDIDPLGITGTPVYDPATNLIFAVAEMTGPIHILIGIDKDTGEIKVRRLADINGMDPAAHQQRGALTLANGMVYIVYGGLAGDCSDYIGRVVASRTDGQGALLSYSIPTAREGGIWAPPGPSVDANGNLYVSVGNGASTSGTWDHSDSILKLSPTLQLLDAFAPTNWGDENANDEDLASQAPVLLPNNFIFAAGKDGKGYTLHTNALGGVGGEVDVTNLCASFGGAAVIDTTLFIPCTNGVRQITIDDQGKIHQGWQANQIISGSPVVGGHTVYSLSNGQIYALAAKNGQVVTSLNVGLMNRFATPTISGNSIFVGTLTGISAVKITPATLS